MLHGCTQDAADFARGTRMSAIADERGFIVLYPEQSASAHAQKCWSWYDPAHQQRDAGEPASIAAITRDITREYHVDPARIFVAGISAGGAMSLVMAATYPDLFAAAAVHSGVPYAAATSAVEALGVMRAGIPDMSAHGQRVVRAMGAHARAVPLLVLHGGADPVVSVVNARQMIEQWDEANRLVMGDGSAPAPARESEGEAGGRRYVRTARAGPNGASTELWVIPDLQHAWSGGHTDGTYTDPVGLDASREIVRFFLEHPRQ
jgi:poly(hydroxyalkanoate) depolymerase family esterase